MGVVALARLFTRQEKDSLSHSIQSKLPFLLASVFPSNSNTCDRLERHCEGHHFLCTSSRRQDSIASPAHCPPTRGCPFHCRHSSTQSHSISILCSMKELGPSLQRHRRGVGAAGAFLAHRSFGDGVDEAFRKIPQHQGEFLRQTLDNAARPSHSNSVSERSGRHCSATASISSSFARQADLSCDHDRGKGFDQLTS